MSENYYVVWDFITGYKEKTCPVSRILFYQSTKPSFLSTGAFWHGCPTCRHAQIRPKTNSDYWEKKLDRTIKRDRDNKSELEKIGWRVFIIWECETKINKLPLLKDKLEQFFTDV